MLVVENFVPIALLAKAPDGAVAQLRFGDSSEIGPATSFRRPRTIEVLVHEASGEAAVGAVAVARDQGNNELCPEVATDAEGRAVIAGLYGSLADVYVGARGESAQQMAGSVDLEQGDGRVEATLAATASVRLRLITDGRAGLPAKFRVFGARILEEFPEKGGLGHALGR